MYKPGDARLALRDINWENDDDFDDPEAVSLTDARDDYTPTYPAAYLPHSCDHWVIGGKEQVQQMITDLQKLLERFG